MVDLRVRCVVFKTSEDRGVGGKAEGRDLFNK